ncbi:MAG TPA: DUF3515 family protein [Marmoricola sp.]|nr:DUF3515 family protein [Marmoricola sp.]
MPRRSHLRTAVALTLAGLVVSACGSTTPRAAPTVIPTPRVTPPATPLPAVRIAQFKPAPGSASACQTIMRNLPTALNSQWRRTTTGSRFAAAWGKPATVLRCGIPEPKTFNKYSSCLTTNGIDWYLEGDIPPMGDTPPPGALTVTTVYRHPVVQVVVPNHYGTQGPSTAMAQLTSVINAHTTASRRCL